jgi:hypothetical protein
MRSGYALSDCVLMALRVRSRNLKATHISRIARIAKLECRALTEKQPANLFVDIDAHLLYA